MIATTSNKISSLWKSHGEGREGIVRPKFFFSSLATENNKISHRLPLFTLDYSERGQDGF